MSIMSGLWIGSTMLRRFAATLLLQRINFPMAALAVCLACLAHAGAVIAAAGQDQPFSDSMREYVRVRKSIAHSPEQSAVAFQQIIAHDPTFYRAYQGLVDAAAYHQNFEEVAQYFQSLLRQEPQSGYAYFGLGNLAELEGKFSVAADNYGKCIRHLPNWWGCYLGLAKSLVNQNKKEEGYALFRDRVAGNRSNPGLLVGLGWLCGTLNHLRQAQDAYIDTLAIARENGDRDLEAQMLLFLSDAIGVTGIHPPEELSNAQQALKAFEDLGDEEGILRSLQELSGLYFRLGNSELGNALLDRLNALAQESGDPQWQERAMMSKGDQLQADGDYGKAGKLYEHAIALCMDVPEKRRRPWRLTILKQQAHIANAQGMYEEGLQFLQELRQGWREEGSIFNDADTLRAIGVLYERMGDYTRAMQAQREAADIFRRGKFEFQAAATEGNIGGLYEELGDYGAAEPYHRKALQAAIRNEDKGEEERNLDNLGQLYVEMGNEEKAKTFLDRAFALSERVRYMPYRVEELLSLAEIHEKKHENNSARENLEAALDLARQIHSIYLEAGADSLLGRHYLKAGEATKAEPYFRDALAIGEKANLRELLWDSEEGLGEVLEQSGNVAQALDQYRKAVDIVESVRGQIPLNDLRSTMLASRIGAYEHTVNLLAQMHRAAPDAGYDNLALAYSERSHARTLLDVIAEGHIDVRNGADAAAMERARALRRVLRDSCERHMNLLSSGGQPEQLSKLETQIRAVQIQYRQVEADIRKNAPVYDSLTEPETLDIGAIQKVVDSDAVLLEYSVGEQASYLWAVDHSAVHMFPLPGRAALEAVVRRCYALLSERNHTGGDADVIGACSKTGSVLLESALPLIHGKRLLIVPDGVLHYLPFGALMVHVDSHRSAPLIQTNEVAILPSATTFSAMRRAAADQNQWRNSIAVLADPVFSKDDPRLSGRTTKNTSTQDVAFQRAVHDSRAGGDTLSRLPFTRFEADDVTATVGKHRSMKAVGFDASLDTVNSPQLSTFGIVHLATHALVDSVHPELSGLILSLFDKEGNPRHGFLRLEDIYNLKLSAGLVVLSACQTGLGKDFKGEGLVGLSRGFMYAGVPRVVASLWKVDDLSTSVLMKRFYYALVVEKTTPSAALRSAQLFVASQKRWASPYFWGGFTLEGRWN